MTESTDAPADAPQAREVVSRASHEDIAVRKVATMHGTDAVAVYFSVRSIREDRCTIRIADPLPEPLRGNEVEFHPKYDPVNLTLAEGTPVYAATVAPDSSRTTVYGVVVDDPDQLQLFNTEPSVEITDRQSVGADGEESDFSFDGAGEASPAEEPAIDGSGGQAPSREPDRPEPAEPSGAGEQSDVVESLVSELRRRDLRDSERRALRRALGMGGEDGVDSRLADLRDEVESLREAVAADHRAAEMDRLETRVEALSRALDERYGSLATAVESLEDAVAREARWRSQLRESLEFDPSGPPADPDRE